MNNSYTRGNCVSHLRLTCPYCLLDGNFPLDEIGPVLHVARRGEVGTTDLPVSYSVHRCSLRVAL